jgi:hypothetical protein
VKTEDRITLKGLTIWKQHSLYLKTARSISLMRIAKRRNAGLRFFGSSLLRQRSSRPISIAELLPTHTSAANFIRITAGNLLTSNQCLIRLAAK